MSTASSVTFFQQSMLLLEKSHTRGRAHLRGRSGRFFTAALSYKKIKRSAPLRRTLAQTGAAPRRRGHRGLRIVSIAAMLLMVRARMYDDGDDRSCPMGSESMTRMMPRRDEAL